MLQNATPLRQSAPRPLNQPVGYVSCTACTSHMTCILTHPLQTPHTSDASLDCCKPHTLGPLLTFDKPQNPWRLPRKAAPGPQEMLRPSEIRTLDFQICFAVERLAHCSTSQLPAMLRAAAPLPFWLPHVLRAAMACAFSAAKSAPELGCLYHFDFDMCFMPPRRLLTPQLPKVLRTRNVF